ncbi:hypothetical protein FOZ63_007531 [Perkinsus olseni]|uniref:Uncharacterized protein n=1 Tax=Perkinsus olseni TaxID=32597 RepID=A0A7J6UE51_PEROL|nr:hypothetical protein FOZ62_006763 [Perkinsus olseni]KAF4755509.1 hypothetical protein FOZ63_007531 [Perkinsus olseni]
MSSSLTGLPSRGRSKDSEFEYLRQLVADKSGRTSLVHSKARDAILRRANTVPKLIPFINQRTATLTEVSHAAHLASFLRSASKATDPGGKATTAYLDVLLMSQENSGVLDTFDGSGSGLDALLYILSLADTMPGSVTSRALLALQLVLNLRVKKSAQWSTVDQERVTSALDVLHSVKKVAENPDVDAESEACRKILSILSGSAASPAGSVVDLMSPPATLTANDTTEDYRGRVLDTPAGRPSSGTPPPPPPPPPHTPPARIGTVTPPVPSSWSSSAWSSRPPSIQPPPPPPTPPSTDARVDDRHPTGARQRSLSRHDDDEQESNSMDDGDSRRGMGESVERKRSLSADTSGTSDASPVKKMRSVREYRSQKRSGNDRSSLLKSYHHTQEYRNFEKFLKDEVYRLTQLHIRRSNPEMCDHEEDEAPEWRRVAKAISQTLMEKELRLDSTVRFNLSSDGLKDSAMKRIKGYCTNYLNRKFPVSR